MVEHFIDILTEENAAAIKHHQALVVIILAHGCKHVGIDLDELPINPNLSAAQRYVFRRPDFKEATKGNDRVTLITTACYSGGWAVDPDLNMTTMAAAGRAQLSEAWVASNSVGRACGSIYMSSLLSALRDECQNALDETEEVEKITAEEKQKTYAAFTDAIYDTLVNRVDRLGTDHDIQFSCQDDDWEAAWGPRTGIPLIDFAQRWNQLKVYHSTEDPTSLRNRDPSIKVGGLCIRGRYGGKCRHRLQMLGLSYLSSFPGRSSLSCNIRLHGKLRKIYRIGEEVKSDELEWLFGSLEGRISQMKMATKILLDCGIPLPRGTESFHYY
ncbi:hypothetical protein V8E54_013685 [Elaphomyces granulatus]